MITNNIYFMSLICLIAVVGSGVGSCANGPKVTVYLSDPAMSGMEFYNQNTKQSGFVNYSDTDKFVCFNPNDAQTLLNYCAVSK